MPRCPAAVLAYGKSGKGSPKGLCRVRKALIVYQMLGKLTNLQTGGSWQNYHLHQTRSSSEAGLCLLCQPGSSWAV